MPINDGTTSKLAMIEHASCALYDKSVCASCGLLGTAPGSRLKQKEAILSQLLYQSKIIPGRSEPIYVPLDPFGSRCKVKMVVSGSIERPIIGIVNSKLEGSRLVDCQLPQENIRNLLVTLEQLIPQMRVPPYRINERDGELKQIVIMSNQDQSEGILRFILRSSEAVARIRKAIPKIQSLHPWIKVITANLQPLPAAIPEGPTEQILTEESFIAETYGPVKLFFGPQSFMQVTHETARALYARAALIASEIRPDSVLDLFCGVGGFALSIAPFAKKVKGVEISSNAILSAEKSALLHGLKHVTFEARSIDDCLTEIVAVKPDLVIVNPPRRGLSQELCRNLCALRPENIIYSSCNPSTLIRDLLQLLPSYELSLCAPFDMFPLTDHLEVLVHLARKN